MRFLVAAGGLVALAMVLTAAPALAGYADVAEELDVDVRTAGEVHDETDDPELAAWPAFPEIIGGGACWADFDGDGYDDLYIVNQEYNRENPTVGSWVDDVDPHSHLFLNDGNGGFDDVSEGSGADNRGFGYGCSAADYDGDGDTDLFVAHFGVSKLYRNRGGAVFDEVGAAAGIPQDGACGEFACMSTNSAWGDYDRDGDLDLFVGNYVETSLTDTERAPIGHVAQLNWLLRNEGDGSFTEVAQDAGVAGRAVDADGSKTFGVLWLDADLDGDSDLYVCNDSEVNEFYVNNGDGTFLDRSVEAGVDNPLSSMGCDSADYDNDGFPDLYMTHYAGENNGFYRNNGDGTFEDRSAEDDLGNDLLFVGWGTAFFDLERDGDLDLFAVNGHTEWQLPDYDMSRLVFRNDPPNAGDDPWNRVWVDVSADMGDGVAQARVGRGAAFADYDFDGDTDIAVINNANQTANFLKADGILGDNHWLSIQLQQPGANRRAIGARVEVLAGGVLQVGELQAGGSFLSQNTINLEFGLGASTRADMVTVHWPTGGTTTVTDVASEQLVRIDRAAGTVLNDTISPLTKAVLSGEEGQGGWWRSAVDATIQADDRGVSFRSGVASTEYAIGDGDWQSDTGETLEFTGEGEHRLRVRSTDVAGNQEPPRETRIGIDMTPPAPPVPSFDGTLGLEGWWVSPSVRVTMGATDALSGVGSFRFRVDGGAWADVSGPFDVSGDGIHVVESAAVDKAGNAGPVASFEVRIDCTAPAAQLDHPREGGVYLGDEEVAQAPVPHAIILTPPDAVVPGMASFTVGAVASDATSGVDRVVFRVDGQVVAVDRQAPYAWVWDTSGWAAGPHEVEAIAVDHAGNLGSHEVQVVLVAAPRPPPAPPLPPPPTLDGPVQAVVARPA